MRIETPTLQYKNGWPFEAQLCRIGRQLPHRHPSELELVYCLEGTVHLEAAEQKEEAAVVWVSPAGERDNDPRRCGQERKVSQDDGIIIKSDHGRLPFLFLKAVTNTISAHSSTQI